jgi:alpha-L-fucosidase
MLMKASLSSKNNQSDSIAWFRQARLGMFIHFGLYSLPGAGTEWRMQTELISRADYRKLMESFNPVNFNADDWIKAAKSMGANYITVTTKHHDGFCLWDTEFTDHKITNTPFGRDLIGELVEACHENDMRIIFYYSLLDWYHPAYVNTEAPDWPSSRPEDQPDWAEYQEYLENQIRELCTKYGRVDGIWWDVGITKNAKEWQSEKLYNLIHELQPEAVVNNRSQIPADFDIGERIISNRTHARLTENCESVGARAWGFTEGEVYHSPEFILNGMINSLVSGCNYLLNVGPKPDGTIPAPAQQRLKAVGNWLELNRKAVWNVERINIPCHYFKRRENNTLGICSKRENTIYLIINERPIMDSFFLFGLKSNPIKIEMRDGTVLTSIPNEYGIEIKGFPFDYTNMFPAVLKLTFAQTPVIDKMVSSKFTPGLIKLEENDENILHPGTARVLGLNGCTPPLVRFSPKDYNATGWWSAEEQFIEWDISVESEREYELLVVYEIGMRGGEVEYLVSVAGNSLKGIMSYQGNMPYFTSSLGKVKIRKGTHCLALRPFKMSTLGCFGDIRKIILRPIQ